MRRWATLASAPWSSLRTKDKFRRDKKKKKKIGRERFVSQSTILGNLLRHPTPHHAAGSRRSGVAGRVRPGLRATPCGKAPRSGGGLGDLRRPKRRAPRRAASRCRGLRVRATECVRGRSTRDISPRYRSVVCDVRGSLPGPGEGGREGGTRWGHVM